MTLIFNGALNQALLRVTPGDIATLIQRLHQFIQITLKQNQEEGLSDDGMELGACYIRSDLQQMTFVGARFNLFIAESGTIREIKGTKKGLGYRSIPYHQRYDDSTIELNAHQTFYMTSDGLIDQIGGGEKKLSYGKKRFCKLLAEIQDIPLDKQKDIIYHDLISFQGDQNRRDDVSVVGFRPPLKT